MPESPEGPPCAVCGYQWGYCICPESPDALDRNVERDRLWLDYKRLQADADRADRNARAAHAKWVEFYCEGRSKGWWT